MDTRVQQTNLQMHKAASEINNEKVYDTEESKEKDD